jgi:hypothetical protein
MRSRSKRSTPRRDESWALIWICWAWTWIGGRRWMVWNEERVGRSLDLRIGSKRMSGRRLTIRTRAAWSSSR